MYYYGLCFRFGMAQDPCVEQFTQTAGSSGTRKCQTVINSHWRLEVALHVHISVKATKTIKWLVSLEQQLPLLARAYRIIICVFYRHHIYVLLPTETQLSMCPVNLKELSPLKALVAHQVLIWSYGIFSVCWH